MYNSLMSIQNKLLNAVGQQYSLKLLFSMSLVEIPIFTVLAAYSYHADNRSILDCYNHYRYSIRVVHTGRIPHCNSYRRHLFLRLHFIDSCCWINVWIRWRYSCHPLGGNEMVRMWTQFPRTPLSIWIWRYDCLDSSGMFSLSTNLTQVSCRCHRSNLLSVDCN